MNGLVVFFIFILTVCNGLKFVSPAGKKSSTLTLWALNKNKNDLAKFPKVAFGIGKFFVGFYSVMLAPIYGIGLPFFFGSMTNFETLQNRAHPGVIANEYIVAPLDFTPARIDQIPPEYNIPPSVLKEEINKVVRRQPRITFVAEDTNTNRLEYIQRSLIFRFPDVITFQILPLEDSSGSTFAVHSYSDCVWQR